jgi:hypothetical protein
MKIRYNIGLAVTMLVLSVFLLGTTLLIGRLTVSTFTGVLVFAIAIGYLYRPIAELTETELTVLALIGPVKRRYPTAQLRFRDGRLYSGDKKVRLPAWTCNGDDWRALQQRVKGGGAA